MAAIKRYRPAVNVTDMKDPELLLLAAAIAAQGPQSPLFAVAAVAASVAAVGTKAAALKGDADAVKTFESQLTNAKTSKVGTRVALENEVTSLAGLVGNNATKASDVTGMAFPLRDTPPTATTDPLPPDTVKVVVPKTVRGHVVVTAHNTGLSRGRYVAEVTTNPIGTWTPLPGTGCSRTVTGASGTQLWVRFARVRAQRQSEWCTPVLVTIP